MSAVVLRVAAALLAALAALAPVALAAQDVRADSNSRPSARSWTAQERADACAHRPGAPLRLYGCPREAFGAAARPEPLYILDGRELPTDTSGAGHAERERLLRALDPRDIIELTLVPPDSAVERYGARARGGVVRIRTARSPGRGTLDSASSSGG